MNKNLRNFVELMVVAQMAGMFVVFFWVFVRAYLNPRKVSCIAINVVGEADVELVILSFFVILFLGYVLYRGKVFVRGVKK